MGSPLGLCYRQPIQPTATGADERLLISHSGIDSRLSIHSKSGQPSHGSILPGGASSRLSVTATFLRGRLQNQYGDLSDCAVKEEVENWNRSRSVVPLRCTTMTLSNAGFASRDGWHPDTPFLRNTHRGRRRRRGLTLKSSKYPTSTDQRGVSITVYTVQTSTTEANPSFDSTSCRTYIVKGTT